MKKFIILALLLVSSNVFGGLTPEEQNEINSVSASAALEEQSKKLTERLDQVEKKVEAHDAVIAGHSLQLEAQAARLVAVEDTVSLVNGGVITLIGKQLWRNLTSVFKKTPKAEAPAAPATAKEDKK